MESYSFVTVDMSAHDYEDLLDLLSLCAEECGKCSELDDLTADFRYFSELLESNRR